MHCVRDTPGAQLHPDIDAGRVDAIVDAGREPEHEGYSGFEHTELERVLRDHDVDTLHVGGLALDYCVKATALDALRLGFAVTVVRDGVAAVDVQPGDGDRALAELKAAGVTLA